MLELEYVYFNINKCKDGLINAEQWSNGVLKLENGNWKLGKNVNLQAQFPVSNFQFLKLFYAP